MILLVKRLNKHATIPVYGTQGAACFDIKTSITESVTIPAGSSAVLPTGLAFEIPLDYVMNLYSRSGHAFKHNVRLANCVGVIDSDYRGELMVKLVADGADYTVKPGEFIAQARLEFVYRTEFVEVDDLSATERGANGFGSTSK
jgi:dUTP pyrophosphatase